MNEVPMRVAVRKPEVPVSVAITKVRVPMTASAGGGSPYTGSYRFTPSGQAQTVQTAGKLLNENIVIDPIPSNYGLITYTGGVITVS